MIDKQLLTTPILAAAWGRTSKSSIRAASKTPPPGGTQRSTPTSTQK